MKFAIPEISWHNRDPVLSVDFQPKTDDNGPLRLATGGTDSHVLIWYISTTESGSVNLEVASDLTRHQKAVNVVRWSPNGIYLASGDDESIIFIWKQKIEKEVIPTIEQGEEQYKETWVIHKTLRGHMEDVLDISWSSDSLHLASGSVDNKLLMWDITRGRYTSILADHKGFVQGVSWDPRGQFIATASTDRVFRTFDISTKKVVSRSSKALLPFPADHPLHDVKVRLYHDDTLQTFYRRLQFSPDGLLVAVPAGKVEPDQAKENTKPMNAVYIYSRYSLKVPACVVPCGEAALAARWSPRRYAARPAGPPAALPAPRRLLAVATRRSVLLYDTQQRTPVALISNIHYTRLTDLTWSPDGLILVASSTDGFCSVITFSDGELGEVLPEEADCQNSEPMQVQTEEMIEIPKEKSQEPKTTKIDSYIKFKAPEKSPKRLRNELQQRTPVKIDLMEEVAMPSWSDNSNTEIIRPKETEQKDIDKSEVMIIEDSEDIKLVYEETVGAKSESPKSPEQKEVSPKQVTPKSTVNTDVQSTFLSQAKVTDVKASAAGGAAGGSARGAAGGAARGAAGGAARGAAAPSPKAPRRVNFVTLSSPKNKKKC